MGQPSKESHIRYRRLHQPAVSFTVGQPIKGSGVNICLFRIGKSSA